ncbi:hypothetical protein HK100_001409 [Physocladia obscura]|uniref:Uncharacterized protein n=1 Tax=Physocladia obscura TaxID=109957 RepID=A0AAD5SZG7_9FUNG|nr:hypothetical protein HK100_001409 [Physocladia obscura]
MEKKNKKHQSIVRRKVDLKKKDDAINQAKMEADKARIETLRNNEKAVQNARSRRGFEFWSSIHETVVGSASADVAFQSFHLPEAPVEQEDLFNLFGTNKPIYEHEVHKNHENSNLDDGEYSGSEQEEIEVSDKENVGNANSQTRQRRVYALADHAVNSIHQDEEEEEDDDNVVAWPTGKPPSWFHAAKKHYLVLRKQRLTDKNVSHIRVIDLTNFDELQSYLNPIEIKEISDSFSKSIAIVLKSPILSKSEIVTQALEVHMQQICETVVLNGPVGGLRALSSILNQTAVVQPNLDELDEIYGANSNALKVYELASNVQKILDFYDSTGYFDSDVKYIFNLFKVSYEMIENGVPSRENTERDLDVNYFWEMFSCLKPISAVHYGEPVSRASRFRRSLSNPNKSEGYHVDYLITSSKAQVGFGDEFAIGENVTSKANPNDKLNTDFNKLMKTMRDTYVMLTRNLIQHSQASPKSMKAMDLLRIGGFRTSGFWLTTSVLIHLGGGFFARGVLDEILVPYEMKHLQDNSKVTRAMLKMKVIH